MTQPRMALATGICYTLPLVLWCLAQLWTTGGSGEAVSVLSGAVRLVLLIQALTLSLFVPRLLCACGWREALGAILILSAVPWPLLTLAWQAEAVDLWTLAVGQGVLAAASLLLWGLCRLLLRLPLPGAAIDALPASLGLAAAALLIPSYPAWTSFTGL